MKKPLLLLAVLMLPVGVTSCGGEKKSTTTQIESVQPVDQAVVVEDREVTHDKYGNTNTVVKQSQTYVPTSPAVKTTTTQVREDD